MSRKPKQTKVVHKKLGNYWGWAYIDENKIEIDERLHGYRYLLYMLHEHFHLRHPDWSETKIKKESSATAQFLWKAKFRWIDLG